MQLKRLASISVLLLCGCGSDTFPKYVDLGGLRILAIRAEGASNSGAAEFSPGDSVRVKPYVSDFRGGTRMVSFSAIGCLDPGVSYGAEPSCDATGPTSLSSGTLNFQAGAVERTGAVDEFTVQIPASILTLRRPTDQYNGVSYLVIYTVTAGGSSVSSFKRLVVTSRSTKNQNPVLTSLQGVTGWPGGDVDLSANIAAGSAETYSSLRNDGTLETRTEKLQTTYFITDGSLKYFRTSGGDTTTYTANGTRPTDHTPLIFAVLRDDRGGISVISQSL